MIAARNGAFKILVARIVRCGPRAVSPTDDNATRYIRGFYESVETQRAANPTNGARPIRRDGKTKPRAETFVASFAAYGNA